MCYQHCLINLMSHYCTRSCKAELAFLNTKLLGIDLITHLTIFNVLSILPKDAFKTITIPQYYHYRSPYHNFMLYTTSIRLLVYIYTTTIYLRKTIDLSSCFHYITPYNYWSSLMLPIYPPYGYRSIYILPLFTSLRL